MHTHIIITLNILIHLKKILLGVEIAQIVVITKLKKKKPISYLQPSSCWNPNHNIIVKVNLYIRILVWFGSIHRTKCSISQ